MSFQSDFEQPAIPAGSMRIALCVGAHWLIATGTIPPSSEGNIEKIREYVSRALVNGGAGLLGIEEVVGRYSAKSYNLDIFAPQDWEIPRFLEGARSPSISKIVRNP